MPFCPQCGAATEPGTVYCAGCAPSLAPPIAASVPATAGKKGIGWAFMILVLALVLLFVIVIVSAIIAAFVFAMGTGVT